MSNNEIVNKLEQLENATKTQWIERIADEEEYEESILTIFFIFSVLSLYLYPDSTKRFCSATMYLMTKLFHIMWW
jgi:hypothetical protein